MRFFLPLLLMVNLCLHAEPIDSTEIELTILSEAIATQLYIDSLNASFTWEHGDVDVNDGMATLRVPEGFKYLDGEQSAYVLTELWGNMPQESLGMLFKEDQFPLDTLAGYVVELSYDEEGYVSDEDANDLDYDELMETMREDVVVENEYRNEMGYPSVILMGWAAAPYYDASNKKLHWAKELYFEGEDTNTLNYNIRVLGREGYITINGIGTMEDLPAFNADSKKILASVNFNEGHRYEDFDSSMDKIAAVGIGGLIAGKVLAKVGILAKFGVILAKFWKFIAIGVVAILAGVRTFFGKKEEELPAAPGADT